MKKLFTSFILFVFSSITFGQLAISAIYDGPLSGGVPKGIELYVVESIPDLSIYGVGFANNGGGTDGQEFTFPADAASAGDYIYVATETTGFTTWFGFAPDYTTGSASINGDDAIELFKNGSVIDLFGDVNLSGTGTAWEYLDGWALSKSTRIASPTFNSNDWTYSTPNAWDDDASATNATSTPPLPIGTVTTLPVELTSFNYSLDGNSVNLIWKTATEVDNYGFEVERSIVNDQSSVWQKIAFIEGAGNSNSVKEYSYVDAAIQNGKYTYRLKQVDVDGQFKYSNEIEVEVGTPAKYALEQNYPNPFNPSTVISYQLQENGMVNLTVYDVLGNEVTNLVNANQEAGKHQVTFNAANLTSGIYFYKLSAGNFTAIKKLMLLK